MNHNEFANGHGFAGHNGLAQGGALMSFDEARQRIEADDCGKWDTLIARNDLRLKDGHLAFPLDEDHHQWQSLQPSSLATGQLCARLGIPVTYFRRCPAVLQDVQANYWLRDTERNGVRCTEETTDNQCDGNNAPANATERWMLRAKGGTVRAVLSERYSPLDNSTLLDHLRPLLSSRYRVDWFGLSEESLHLRVVDLQRTREVLPDDALSVGVHIANSEVGFRAVTVDALVYRLVCKNGLVRLVKGKSFLHRRHVYLDEARFTLALQEAVAAALNEAESFLQQLARTTTQRVEDGVGALEQLAEKRGLPDHLRQAMTSALQREGGQSETLYGLVNAVTETAQRLPDEGRYDLEVLAGQLAQHGVAAYTPRRSANKSARIAVPDDATRQVVEMPSALREAFATREEETESELTKDEGLTANEEKAMRQEIVELAQVMFGAEIVSRVPHGAQPRESEVVEVTV